MLNQPRGGCFSATVVPCWVTGSAGLETGLPMFPLWPVESVEREGVLRLSGAAGFAPRWFEHGRLTMLTGAAAGLVGMVKNDRLGPDGRIVELWQSFGAVVGAGDQGRLEAGCDKKMATCRGKFSNLMNFRGFPHIPGEDWMVAFPANGKRNDGGSLNR
jgi:uncharacterized phage protein (TIGR02218 family)